MNGYNIPIRSLTLGAIFYVLGHSLAVMAADDPLALPPSAITKAEEDQKKKQQAAEQPPGVYEVPKRGSQPASQTEPPRTTSRPPRSRSERPTSNQPPPRGQARAENPPRGETAHSGARDTGQSTGGSVLTDQIMAHKIGTEKLQQLLEEIRKGDSGIQGSGGTVWYDHGRPRTSNVDNSRPLGTQSFQTGQSAVAHPSVRAATVEEAKAEVKTYGSYGGGVAVEGVAIGLGEIDSVRYDTRFNAFILNDRAAYFMTIPPKTVAILCRAIAQDKLARIGVSLAEKPIVYGQVPSDSDLAMDLEMADHFLGNIVFADDEWSKGYVFPDGFKPQASTDTSVGLAVHFRFSGFRFQIEEKEVHLADVDFDIQLVPLSKTKAEDGGLLPDYTLIAQGHSTPEYEANARHIVNNLAYYRRERIVERVFVYGEVAAFLRALKKAGFNLEEVASHVPGG